MALDPGLVKFAIELRNGALLSLAEAEALAGVLETREELLAYLFMRTDFLDLHPDIKKEVFRIAREGGYQAATKRATVGQPAGARTLASEFHDALLSAIGNEPANSQSLSRLDELDRLMARYNLADAPFERAPERWIKS